MNDELKPDAVESTGLVARLRHGLGYGGDKYGLISGSEVMDTAADRIEELELAIRLAGDKFFTDGSDKSAAAAMMRILKDVEISPSATVEVSQRGEKETT